MKDVCNKNATGLNLRQVYSNHTRAKLICLVGVEGIADMFSPIAAKSMIVNEP